MIRVVLVLMSLGVMASCGADGVPIAPAATAPAPAGVTFDGTMSAGEAINGTGY